MFEFSLSSSRFINLLITKQSVHYFLFFHQQVNILCVYTCSLSAHLLFTQLFLVPYKNMCEDPIYLMMLQLVCIFSSVLQRRSSLGIKQECVVGARQRVAEHHWLM